MLIEILFTLAIIPIAAILAIIGYYIIGYIFFVILFLACRYTFPEAHREAINELSRPLIK